MHGNDFLCCSGKLIKPHQHIVLSFKEKNNLLCVFITNIHSLVVANDSKDDIEGERPHKQDSTQKEVGQATECCGKQMKL